MKNELSASQKIIFAQLIDKIEESKVYFLRLDEFSLRKKIDALIKVILRENREAVLTAEACQELSNDAKAYFLGLGPLERLLKDPDISEIMINGPKQVYIEEDGNLELTDITFKDEDHLLHYIDKMVMYLGRRVTELEPYVDTILKDGSRINIVKNPISLKGYIVTIRKFVRRVLDVNELIRTQTLNELSMEFLKACVISRLNILISGGASSGKTTLLNILASLISEKERLVTIEDTPELNITIAHVVPLTTRPASIEGKGEIAIRDLVKNALHMRPDRIIVGEVRSDEVLEMIQAMNTGHEGSMTTLHANSPLDALDRLEVLALMSRVNLSSEVARRQIISAVDLVIQMSRFSDGSRKITQISELIKSKEYQLQDVFVFEGGSLKLTGEIPIFYPRLKDKANYICKEFEHG